MVSDARLESLMVAAMHDVIAQATAGCVQVDHAMLARRLALRGAGRRDTMIQTTRQSRNSP
jgi:hypothetical protein